VNKSSGGATPHAVPFKLRYSCMKGAAALLPIHDKAAARASDELQCQKQHQLQQLDVRMSIWAISMLHGGVT
jgi:hypothetical protein